MNVLLIQADGKIPNIALMRVSEHHRIRGDLTDLRWGFNGRHLGDQFDLVYCSAIFEKTRPVVQRVLSEYPNAFTGGTGVDLSVSLEQHGITTQNQDYSHYPRWKQSIGFSQRGCRLKCSFCVVPRKEGAVKENKSIFEIWRGEPWPREIILLDNDFFGQPNWRKRIDEIQTGKFKVSFNQGINSRMLTDESAAAIASVDYRADDMKQRRIYTAWDNRKDEKRLFDGLNALVKHGVLPGHIMVYILIGFWPGETSEDWDYRRAQLRSFGALPYPMPFVRNDETIGFQRFVITHYDKQVSWKDFKDAGYRSPFTHKDFTTPELSLA